MTNKQEPVAWVDATGFIYKIKPEPVWPEVQPLKPLYTHPQPKREWVGLTDDEIDEGLLRSDYALQTAHAWRAGVVFAMTKLKEKNT